jgi:hypothetical protein
LTAVYLAYRLVKSRTSIMVSIIRELGFSLVDLNSSNEKFSGL